VFFFFFKLEIRFANFKVFDLFSEHFFKKVAEFCA